MRRIKKTLKMNPYFLTGDEVERWKALEVEIHFDAELDEFWSFIGNKSNHRWTRYAIERNSGIILHGTTEKGRTKIFWNSGNYFKTFALSDTTLIIGGLIPNASHWKRPNM